MQNSRRPRWPQTLRAIAYALGLRRRNALLNSVVDSSMDCIVCVDDQGRIQTANPAAAKLFGREIGSLLGRSIRHHIPGLPLTSSTAGEHPFEPLTASLSEWEATSDAGTTFPVELSISRVRLTEELLYTVIVRDISERRRRQQALEYQATHDPLTELPNRVALAAHLEQVLSRANDAKPVALFMLDLCRFKEVNDTLGHNAGDRVLCDVADRFRETLGGEGFIARIGGDEFTVVMDGVDRPTMLRDTAERLQKSLSAPIEMDGIAIEVGLSIGVALYPLDALDANTLLKHADVAMYMSKRSRSAYECYDSAHDQHSLRRLTLVSELRGAIGTPSVSLHYQPKVHLHSGRADSVEALLRWQHVKFGGVSPAELVVAAEATDLIVPLTGWTLHEALEQIVRWQRQGLDTQIAVNLSARMLQDTTLPARLRALFERSEARPGSLEIEITESAMMVDPARALRVLNEVHELGVRVAVDDYGTGYSSLGYLRDLPIHALKLDKSFVMNMRERAGDRIIVESTVQMARALKLEVVAEGVETEWDAQFLAEIGCDYAQGYWYSKALPPGDCAAWMHDFNASAPSRQAAQQAGHFHRAVGAAP